MRLTPRRLPAPVPLLAILLTLGPACRGGESPTDDTGDTDSDTEVACVEPPTLGEQIDLINRACAAEFVCRGLPGRDTDPAYLQDCMPRRTRALQTCLRTESALACLENVRRDRNCIGLESEPCQRVFACDER